MDTMNTMDTRDTDSVRHAARPPAVPVRPAAISGYGMSMEISSDITAGLGEGPIPTIHIYIYVYIYIH